MPLFKYPEKNNLSKNTSGDIKMLWKVYANEYTKLLYSNSFCIYFSFIYFVFASLAKAKYLTSEAWSKLKQCIIENFLTEYNSYKCSPLYLSNLYFLQHTEKHLNE